MTFTVLKLHCDNSRCQLKEMYQGTKFIKNGCSFYEIEILQY